MLCSVAADNGVPSAWRCRLIVRNIARSSAIVNAASGIRSRCGSMYTRRCDSYIRRVLGRNETRPASQ
jgi:hypothetical protein